MTTFAVKVASLFAALNGLLALAQATQNVDIFAPNMSVNYVNRAPVDIGTVSAQPMNSVSGLTLEFPPGADDSSAVFSAGASANAPSNAVRIPNNDGDQDDEKKGGNITGLLTVPTFAGAFAAQGTENTGQVFPYIMVGNEPLLGGTTTIPTRIVTVSLQLLNADGSIRAAVPYAPFERLTLHSPNFREADYTSGETQFADAVQRAEFFHTMADDWHTQLRPRIVDQVTIRIPLNVQVRFPDGSIKTVQAYYLGQANDGSFYVRLLNLLFNSLNNNLAVSEIVNGNFKTYGYNLNLYPNTFLFSINTQGQPASCCVLGFHTYYLESGVVPQPRWLFAFASWTSPGIFRGGVADVTAISHETSETFNDPFVNTAVPVWQFPGVPANSRSCQGNLETGDPVEVLPNSVFPVTLPVGSEQFTFHPQTEALLQWFEMGTTSNAIDGAFSYPDTSALPHSALPCPPAS
jgi:hypothetical protein